MSKMKFLLYSICGIFVMTVSAKSENNPKPLSDAQNALKNSLDPLTGALTHHLEALMRKSTQAIDALVAQNFNEAKILKVVLASIQNSIQPSAPASQATTEQIGSEKKETPIAPPSDSMQQTTQPANMAMCRMRTPYLQKRMLMKTTTSMTMLQQSPLT